MDISQILRDEIERRGLTVTATAEGAGVAFSTVSEFLRKAREVGTDKASRIAEFLGFDLTISRIRKKEMADYLALVEELEGRGVSVDDDTMEQVKQFASDLRFIEERYEDWSEDDAGLARQFAGDLSWLDENGWSEWTEEDAGLARDLVVNLTWLEENGWSTTYSEEDAAEVGAFVGNLETLEEWGEDPTPERIAEVAEFVRNLEQAEDA